MTTTKGGNKHMNVTIYVNGKRVTKEELGNIEIHNEMIKKMLAEKLSISSGNNKNDSIPLSQNKTQ